MRKFLISLFLSLILPSTSFAAIVFETNFDSNANWNQDSSKNSEAGIPCQLDGTCSDAPTNWTGYRIVPSTMHTHNVPVGSIQRPIGNLADHTTGTGKAYIVYQASDLPDEPGVWKGDGQIGKVLPQTYPELYIQFWFRTQANWQQVTSIGSAMKVFRITYTHNKSNAFEQGNNTPSVYFDLGGASWTSPVGKGVFYPSYRCNPNDYYCHNYSCNVSSDPGCTHQSWMNGDAYGDDWPLTPTGYPSVNFADGNWHRVSMHLKMNTSGQNNGTASFYWDGNTVISRDIARFLESGADTTGFDTVFLGGNSHNNYTTNGDQWYAIDDLVISTTPIAADYIPGGESVNNASSSLTSKGGTGSKNTITSSNQVPQVNQKKANIKF